RSDSPRPRDGGYLTSTDLTLFRGRRLRPFWGNQRRIEHTHIRQVSVPLREVEAVADHEPVRDLEADVAHGDVDLPALRLRQKRTDFQRRGLSRLQVAHQIGEGETGVDDVLDDEDLASLDVDVEVLENPHNSGRVGRVAVTRDRHEVDLARDRQAP